MGLTVHWDLEFKGTEQEVIGKLEQLRKIAEKLPLEELEGPTELEHDKWSLDKFHLKKGYGDWRDWACIQGGFCDGQPITKCYCLYMWPGEGCEAMNIGLKRVRNAKVWNWSSFCKTQYAEEFIKCHLLVIRVLDECKKLGILKEVHDEGRYWETRDLKKLAADVNASTMMIQALFGQLSKAFGEKNVKSPVTDTQTHVTEFEVDSVKKCGESLPPGSNN